MGDGGIMELFNKGDTACLLLNYQVNGSPLVEGAYQEIEFQVNPQLYINSVKKLLSKNEIEWTTVTYEDEEGETQTFTGYVTYLTQQDTFKMGSGDSKVQLRIMMNNEVGSSNYSVITIGDALSGEVL